MFASTPCLKDFLSPAPSIPAQSTVGELRSQFSKGKCDRVAVVDAQQKPIGFISVARYFAYMQRETHQTGDLSLANSPSDERRGSAPVPAHRGSAPVPAHRGNAPVPAHKNPPEKGTTGSETEDNHHRYQLPSLVEQQPGAERSRDNRTGMGDETPQSGQQNHRYVGRAQPTPTKQSDLSLHQTDLLEDIATLPANLSIEQLCHYPSYRRQIAGGNQTPCVLVDSAGKYLGWLDLPALTAFLAQFYPEKTATTPSPSPSPKNRSWTSFLEKLPIPMIWQRQNGTDWIANQAWKEEIAAVESAESVEKEALSLLFSPDRSTANPSAHGRPRKRTGSAPLSAPENSNNSSGWQSQQVQVFQKDNYRGTQHCHLTKSNSCVCVCSRKNGEEQIFRFIKISHPAPETVPSRAEPSRSATELRSAPSPAAGTDSQTTETTGKPSSSGTASPAAGETPLNLVMAQDVTEQEHLSQELAAKNRDLVHLNRLKDEFLSCISHELKTPLTAVLGLSSLLKEQTLGKLNERQLRYAKLIYRSGRHLMDVVNEILDLTRLETGQLELNPEPVSVRQICDRALEQAQHAYKKQSHDQNELDGDTAETGNPCNQPQVSVEIEPGLETIVADELRLRQMLCYLLTNAYKFTYRSDRTTDQQTESGGASESVPNETEPHLGLRVKRRAGWIAFSVWDTGIGIPEDKQHLIFQKFQQIENPLTRQFEGAGLGLVLTQRLTRLHGGEISFISKEGKGSEFTLLLPPVPPAGGDSAAAKTCSDRTGGESGTEPYVEQRRSADRDQQRESVVSSVQDTPSPEVASTNTQPASSEFVTNTASSAEALAVSDAEPHSNQLLLLVVDASGKNIEDFTNILQSVGEDYQVAIARSGTEALEKARRLQPGLIFLNPLVPLLSGWDVLTLLKSQTDTRHIQVVVTGTQVEKEKSAPLADGFCALPFEAKPLQEVLAQFQLSPLATEQAKLTILQLNVETLPQNCSEQFHRQHREWLDRMNGILHQHGCRILEAEDLDSAEVLGRIWQPHAVLLMPYRANESPSDSGGSERMEDFLRQVIQMEPLVSLPLITLDSYTTQVANRVVASARNTEMQVFPCLAAETSTVEAVCEVPLPRENSFPFPDPKTLLQAIQVAVTQNSRPQIAIAEVADGGNSDSGSVQQEVQALVQYLDQAGFQGAIHLPWKQVWQQLQCRSIDLLVLFSPCRQLSEQMHDSLVSLEQLQDKPPILVAETTPQLDASTHSLLNAIASRVLSVTESSPLTLLAEVRKQLGSSNLTGSEAEPQQNFNENQFGSE